MPQRPDFTCFPKRTWLTVYMGCLSLGVGKSYSIFVLCCELRCKETQIHFFHDSNNIARGKTPTTMGFSQEQIAWASSSGFGYLVNKSCFNKWKSTYIKTHEHIWTYYKISCNTLQSTKAGYQCVPTKQSDTCAREKPGESIPAARPWLLGLVLTPCQCF